ncbi:MAG: hypothetical protein ACE5HA_19720, partial [Anaerolineae bacterium]
LSSLPSTSSGRRFEFPSTGSGHRLADEAGDDDWANPVVWRSQRVDQGRHLPQDLSEAVARQFWQAVSNGPVRDQAMVALMLDVGLRVGEVAGLRVQDFEPAVRPGELPATWRA